MTDTNVISLFPKPVPRDPIDEVIHRGWKEEDIVRDFESWFSSSPGFKSYMLEKEDNGQYVYDSVQSSWFGWLASRYTYLRRRLTDVGD